ncbi:ATP-binding protein [Sphingomonas sp. RT2P30]|uniref:sensor histidine kinase n=1 Tax=Parasphingomonas halimpatiens TaxID=3096162 RepID=UPI002FCAE826
MRIYLALLTSLVVAAVLFGLAHRGYGTVPVTMPGARAHVSMLGLLMVIALVVALASYPVIRRLTRGLERLEASVAAWGAGDLSARVAVEGRDEVARLAISFNEAAARVEALMRAQKTLLANASHELRSPLARIRMAIELLEDSAPAALRTELARNIAELDQLIGEVLLASRLDMAGARERPFVEVDLAALVAEECSRMAVDCAVEAVSIPGDPALIRRMIRNLLENALRHGGNTPTSATLTLSTGSAQLDVIDGGSGVPEVDREAIFTPFYRVRGASEADGGHGLGLSLVRQIARRHGGDVCCLEGPGGGAAFRVTFPRPV